MVLQPKHLEAPAADTDAPQAKRRRLMSKCVTELKMHIYIYMYVYMSTDRNGVFKPW